MGAESIALMALTGAAGAVSAYGQSKGQAYQAAVAERDALVARTQAAQVDTQLREELGRTLSTISAVRGSTGTEVKSPTGMAIMDEQRQVGDRERAIRVGSLNMQARAKDDEAQFRRQAARVSLLGGGLDAVTGMAKIGFGGMKSAGSSGTSIY